MGKGLLIMNCCFSPCTSFSLLTCSCIDFSREEHKKHSSGCAFLSVKKQFEELTLGEFLKLDKERAKNKIVCIMGSESHAAAVCSTLSIKLSSPSQRLDALFLCKHFLRPSGVCVRIEKDRKTSLLECGLGAGQSEKRVPR